MDDRDADDRLLARSGRGEGEAFRCLVDRHAGQVQSLARSVLGSVADAEEVTQEVFLIVWKKAESWRPGSARFSTWLHRVTLNQSLNYRQRRVLKYEPLEEVPELKDPGSPPDERLDAQQWKERITKAVDGLPEGQRTAIVLTYGSGLTNAEAARVMNVSIKALEALLVRARRRLREVIGSGGSPGSVAEY
jgi:RNA polymerase sigma-70 factor (ECF subfamily)